MNDEMKEVVHFLDGESIHCGINVIDTINSYRSNGGIAIVSRGETIPYVTVRYATDIARCSCPECIVKALGISAMV